MVAAVRPIRTKRDHEAALKEVERLWGGKIGTPDGDRLDVLATLIDAYESEHYPMHPPDPIRRKMENIRRMKPRVNRANIAATTEADIRRHMREDGQSELD